MPIDSESLTLGNRHNIYSLAQIEEIFFIWYKANRCTIQQLQTLCSESGINPVPSIHNLYRWKDHHKWLDKADVLDQQVMKQIETKAIEEKVEMYRRHSEMAKSLQDMAFAYFQENGIDNAKVALTAVIKGAELERISRGIPDALQKVAKLQDEELSSIVTKLLGKVSLPDKAIEELKEDESEEEIVEGEFEDKGNVENE